MLENIVSPFRKVQDCLIWTGIRWDTIFLAERTLELQNSENAKAQLPCVERPVCVCSCLGDTHFVMDSITHTNKPFSIMHIIQHVFFKIKRTKRLKSFTLRFRNEEGVEVPASTTYAPPLPTSCTPHSLLQLTSLGQGLSLSHSLHSHTLGKRKKKEKWRETVEEEEERNEFLSPHSLK